MDWWYAPRPSDCKLPPCCVKAIGPAAIAKARDSPVVKRVEAFLETPPLAPVLHRTWALHDAVTRSNAHGVYYVEVALSPLGVARCAVDDAEPRDARAIVAVHVPFNTRVELGFVVRCEAVADDRSLPSLSESLAQAWQLPIASAPADLSALLMQATSGVQDPMTRPPLLPGPTYADNRFSRSFPCVAIRRMNASLFARARRFP